MAICENRNWLSGLLEIFSIVGVLADGIFCCENHALAQITPDETLVDRSSITSNVNIKGSAADRIDGGTIRGANLFHSFQEFNVGESQRVYFANPTGISNILTRVTGSNISNILGTLGVNGNANLFLINPNGILFGNNARLDVAGSFVASTANSFGFGNGLEFSATNPQTPSSLLTVNPSALLFNQLQAGRIENRSIASAGIAPAGLNAFGLRVGDGKSLLLVGGNVSMNGGKLNAFGGRVELGGLAAPGNVNLVLNGDNLNLKFPENVTRADVSLNNQAGVFVTGAGSGNIAINARNLEILEGSILSAGIGQGLGTSESVAGEITLKATGEIKIADSGSTIRNFVRLEAKGNGGNIIINSGSFSLRDGTQLIASTYGQGNAGNVKVDVKDAVSLAGNAYIVSTVETGGVGQGGNIDIYAATLSLTDGAQLSASTLGQGNGGNVTVDVKDAISLANGAILSRVSAGGVGKGGNININATTLSLTDGAQLLTSTRGASATQPAGRGNAGNVNVKVTGAVDIAGEKNGFFSGIGSNVGTGTVGNGGSITIDSGDFSLRDGAFLAASTSGQGNGGNVTVGVKDLLLLRRGAQISTNAGTEKLGGNGGNININSRFIVAVPNENSDISANAFTGIGGRVDITTNGIFGILPQKSLTEKSDITASSPLGVSGEVTINSPDTDPSRGLIQLPSNLVDASQQIAQGCTPRRGQNASRFIATGRGGLPQSPNEPLQGRAVITGWVDLPAQATAITDKSSTASMTKSSDEIVEAQGWIVDGNGDIMLVAQSVQSSFIPSAISCSQPQLLETLRERGSQKSKVKSQKF
ncbi:filamentous hemagglutinin N-terminal domain-containing protein [Nostoc sp. ChiQUE01b]|uniref:two-partner secretion domain-containing protein n=1 Tax=Nostoc sp. ChiQUE01b TaxID=3075376 RepID=UPI002AD43105|nr:filamentous hemagglutinin N-terminal domain-containing protein [Nostoc sp. ChiQUE01b]MDZ8263107.1 filamentous hemagglutinin N-terminal domain-containing protein [Nostoc sp. ChiQUE01b]